MRQRKPDGLAHLVSVGPRRDIARQRVDVGPDHEADGPIAGDGLNVVEAAQEVAMLLEVDTDLFLSLAGGRAQEIVAVIGVVPPTGQRHVTRPGIAGPLAPLDQQRLALAAALALTAGLFHVFNHSIFKSLLFFGAGAVLNATGERDMEHLGGLIHRMGTTGAAFLVGSAAISGLPPLNGFVSEFLIYVAAFGFLAGNAGAGAAGLPAVVGILALAMIGGLAGTVGGVAISKIISALAGWSTVISPFSVILSLGSRSLHGFLRRYRATRLHGKKPVLHPC